MPSFMVKTSKSKWREGVGMSCCPAWPWAAWQDVGSLVGRCVHSLTISPPASISLQQLVPVSWSSKKMSLNAEIKYISCRVCCGVGGWGLGVGAGVGNHCSHQIHTGCLLGPGTPTPGPPALPHTSSAQRGRKLNLF